jgi:hypothetical protein
VRKKRRDRELKRQNAPQDAKPPMVPPSAQAMACAEQQP